MHVFVCVLKLMMSIFCFSIFPVLPYGRNLYVSIPKEQYEVVKGGEVTLPCTFSPSNPDYQDLVLTWTAFPDKEGDTMVRGYNGFFSEFVDTYNICKYYFVL